MSGGTTIRISNVTKKLLDEVIDSLKKDFYDTHGVVAKFTHDKIIDYLVRSKLAEIEDKHALRP